MPTILFCCSSTISIWSISQACISSKKSSLCTFTCQKKYRFTAWSMLTTTGWQVMRSIKFPSNWQRLYFKFTLCNTNKVWPWMEQILPLKCLLHMGISLRETFLLIWKLWKFWLAIMECRHLKSSARCLTGTLCYPIGVLLKFGALNILAFKESGNFHRLNL